MNPLSLTDSFFFDNKKCGTMLLNITESENEQMGGLYVFKSLSYGIIIFLTILVGAKLVGDLRMAMSFAGGLGLVCLFLCGTLSGAFINDESAEVITGGGPNLTQKRKTKWTIRTLLFAAPNVIGGLGILYYLS